MFTGIVEEIGEITALRPISNGIRIQVQADRVLSDLKVEDSISINGACQTVIAIEGNKFWVEAVGDTLTKTNMGKLHQGNKVNMERALTLSTRLGGHLVAGHVNGTGIIQEIKPLGINWFYKIRLDKSLLKYCVDEGSIAVDGVSLTIAEKSDSYVRLSIISHTYRNTIFSYYQTGTIVNIEVDLIAKYIESLLTNGKNISNGSFDLNQLKEWGF